MTRRFLAAVAVAASLAVAGLVPAGASAATYNEAVLWSTYWTIGTAQSMGTVISAPTYPVSCTQAYQSAYNCFTAWVVLSGSRVVRCTTTVVVKSVPQIVVVERSGYRRCV